jgi:hypothetical protein
LYGAKKCHSLPLSIRTSNYSSNKGPVSQLNEKIYPNQLGSQFSVILAWFIKDHLHLKSQSKNQKILEAFLIYYHESPITKEFENPASKN